LRWTRLVESAVRPATLPKGRFFHLKPAKRCAVLQLDPVSEESGNEPSAYQALIVVDADAQVKFKYWDGRAGEEAKEILFEEGGTRLRTWLQVLVRSLIDEAPRLDLESYVVLREAGRTLRLLPLAGLEGTLFGLVMEADRADATIARAASRYKLTPRQTEVLVLLLGGSSAADIARSLVISEYTAQGYVKNLLAKTDSRNRATMIGKVLNWKQPRHALPRAHGVHPG
jgi:DNA-binding CsgD family transcriptional regulator